LLWARATGTALAIFPHLSACFWTFTRLPCQNIERAVVRSILLAAGRTDAGTRSAVFISVSGVLAGGGDRGTIVSPSPLTSGLSGSCPRSSSCRKIFRPFKFGAEPAHFWVNFKAELDLSIRDCRNFVGNVFDRKLQLSLRPTFFHARR